MCLSLTIEDALTNWGRVTHVCVDKLTIIGSDNGLSPERRQAIIWTNAGILLIRPLGTNFSEILIEIQTFSLKKIRLKISSAKCCSFRLGLNVRCEFDCHPARGHQPPKQCLKLGKVMYFLYTLANNFVSISLANMYHIFSKTLCSHYSSYRTTASHASPMRHECIIFLRPTLRHLILCSCEASIYFSKQYHNSTWISLANISNLQTQNFPHRWHINFWNTLNFILFHH